MSDGPAPTTWDTAAPSLLWGVFAFAFGFEGVAMLFEGKLILSAIGIVAAIGLTAIAMKWKKIAALSPRLSKTTTLVATDARAWIVIMLLLFSSIAGPNIYTRVANLNDNGQVGNIIWNFEQTARGIGYFLTLQHINNEIRFINFGAHGKNISNNPISKFRGYLRSDLTNAQLPIYLLAQSAEAITALACFPNPRIPTLPDETFSIPPHADFEITTFNKTFIETGKDGIPIDMFWKNFGPFALILEYDDVHFQRHFSRKEIQGQIDMLIKSLDPKSNPFVLRKPNASPASLAPLEPLILKGSTSPTLLTIPTKPVPPLATPVPPGAFQSIDLDKIPTGTVLPRN